MFFDRVLHLILGSSVLVAHPVVGSDVEPTSVAELVTHECALDVATLVDLERPPGPLFGRGGLLLTSVEDAAGRPRLVMSAGDGVYALELPGEGLVRLRFELYDPRALRAVTYYLGYFHDPATGSRVLEFGAGDPPVGHFEFDYLTVTPRRAAGLRPHLEYAAYLTSARLRRALDEGRVTVDRMRPRAKTACDHLARENPALAASLDNNLEEFDRRMHAGPRAPARAN